MKVQPLIWYKIRPFKKGLIDTQNIDDSECFKWYLIRYLQLAYHCPARLFGDKLDFKSKKLTGKIRDTCKSSTISTSIFGYENQYIYPIYVSKKCCEGKHVDLLLIEEKGQRYYVLIKDFNGFMYDHKLHRGGEHFCHCCLAFSLAKILESNVLDCFKISGKQIIKMHKKGKYVRLKNYEKKIKSPFMMYAVCESILVSEYIMGSQIGTSFIQTNIKSILLAVMVIN